jgi:DNA-binding beta-propeller fold protein YncE
MRLATWISLAAMIVLAGHLVGGCNAPAAKDLEVVRMLPGGGDGGWDYITVDPAAARAYVARSTRVMVLSLHDGGLLGEVADVSGAHGVALAPALNLGFATAGRDGAINVFDLKTFATLRKIKAGQRPDAILFDDASGKVFAFNHGSGDVTIIDAANLDAPPTVLPVGGTLEFGVADGAGRVYVNIEDKSEVAVIDSRGAKVVARWSVAPGAEPTGLAIDPARGRLFVGCSNRKMIILDARTGKMLADVPVGSGVDGVAFDAHLRVAVSANGRDGTATTVAEVSPGRFAPIQTITTAKGARTVAADPDKHRFYLPCTPPAQSGKGSFGLLVIARPGEK